MQKISPPVMQPWHLASAAEISRVFKCGREAIYRMTERGAPIAVVGSGPNKRYSAEYNQLQAWRVAESLGNKNSGA